PPSSFVNTYTSASNPVCGVIDPCFASTIPRSISCFSIPRNNNPTLSPACPSSNNLRNISTPVATPPLSVPHPTTSPPPPPPSAPTPSPSPSPPTHPSPRSIRPLATVPRPVIENTSSTGIKNGLSTSRCGIGTCVSNASNNSQISPTAPASPSNARNADPRITGTSSPGNSYFDNNSRTSSSTRSNRSTSSTKSHLFRNTTM